jgi:hypothetical protein
MLGFGLNPVSAFACGQSSVPNASSETQRLNITDWQGEYNFTERGQSQSNPNEMNYVIHLVSTRCASFGLSARMIINGPLRSVDFTLEALGIDPNTIGLYFIADVPNPNSPKSSPKHQFKSGDLLLRIQKTAPNPSSPSKTDAPIYRIYFEKLSPVLPQTKSDGLDIEPPLPLRW